MPRLGSARRYAQAVFELATERSELDVWLDDLTYLALTLQSAQFGEFLDSPQASEDRKAELIGNTLGDRVSPFARNLISLLASRSMTSLMPGIVDQYQRLLDAHQGIEQARRQFQCCQLRCRPALAAEPHQQTLGQIHSTMQEGCLVHISCHPHLCLNRRCMNHRV